MRVSLKRPTAEIKHPGHPEVVVTVQKPNDFVIEDLKAMYRRYQRPVAIVGPDGLPVMVERDGVMTVATEIQNVAPADSTLRACVAFVADVSGFENDNGEPIKYKGTVEEKMEVLRFFSDDAFIIRFSPPRPVLDPEGAQVTHPVTGEPLTQTVQSAYDWIIEKAGNNETYGLSSGKG